MRLELGRDGGRDLLASTRSSSLADAATRRAVLLERALEPLGLLGELRLERRDQLLLALRRPARARSVRLCWSAVELGAPVGEALLDRALRVGRARARASPSRRARARRRRGGAPRRSGAPPRRAREIAWERARASVSLELLRRAARPPARSPRRSAPCRARSRRRARVERCARAPERARDARPRPRRRRAATIATMAATVTTRQVRRAVTSAAASRMFAHGRMRSARSIGSTPSSVPSVRRACRTGRRERPLDEDQRGARTRPRGSPRPGASRPARRRRSGPGTRPTRARAPRRCGSRRRTTRGCRRGRGRRRRRRRRAGPSPSATAAQMPIAQAPASETTASATSTAVWDRACASGRPFSSSSAWAATPSASAKAAIVQSIRSVRNTRRERRAERDVREVPEPCRAGGGA